MSWGSPELMWFLLALLIPVIIHLFYFKRIKEVVFSNVSALLSLQLTKKNAKNLKKYLLLCTRLLFLVFLVATFSQLLTSSDDAEGNSKGNFIVYLDNSVSLQIPSSSSAEGMNSSVEFVNQLITQSSVDSEIQIITNDPIGSSKQNKFSAAEMLSSLTYGNTNGEALAILKQKSSELSGYKVYLVSDFQNIEAKKIVASIDTDIDLVQVLPDYSYNVFVDTVYLSSAFFNPVGKNALTIKLDLQGGSVDGELQVKVLNDNRLLSTNQVQIIDGQIDELQIEILPSILSSEQVVIEINDPNVLYDNRYYFSLPVYDAVKVSYLYSDKENPFVTSAFGNPKLFDLQSTRYDVVSYDNLESSDLIVVEGLEVIPPFYRNLQDKVFVIIPGKESDIENYTSSMNLQLETLENPQSRQIDVRSLDHYLFQSTFTDITDNLDLPSYRSIFEVSGIFESILFDQFDMPYLTMTENSNGCRTFFFSSPLELSYTSLPNHSIFVPLMYGIAFEAGATNRSLTFRIDQEYLSIGGLELNAQRPVTLLSDQNSYYAQLASNQKGTQLVVPEELKDPGFYQLIYDEDTLMTLAINQSKVESLMNFPSQEELESLAKDNSQINYRRVDDTQLSAGIVNEGQASYWQLTLILAFVFLIGEVLITRLL